MSQGAPSAVIWHDVECAAYTADLVLWEELAAAGDGPILDLGCGTGRVGLHLARRGHEVTGLDLDPALVSAFNKRTGGLTARAEVGDARDFALNREFALVIAPMQLFQLFSGSRERGASLSCVASHLQSGGKAAVTIVDEVHDAGAGEAECIPDVREVQGSVYASTPLQTEVGAGEIAIRRERKMIAPSGDMASELNEVRLQVLAADSLEHEGRVAGLRPIMRREVPATDLHVGSTAIAFDGGC
jgi:SAM-dependent methyltransferase